MHGVQLELLADLTDVLRRHPVVNNTSTDVQIRKTYVPICI